MSTGKDAQSEAQAAAVEVQEGSLLDQAIKATKQTDESRAQELLRTLTEEAGTVTIPITSTPTGASVSINGVTQPDRTPLHATVPVGRSHMIVISAEGHEAHTQEIQPVEGDTPVIHATLRQTPKP